MIMIIYIELAKSKAKKGLLIMWQAHFWLYILYFNYKPPTVNTITNTRQ